MMTLTDAAYDGDLEKVKELIAAGADVNGGDKHGLPLTESSSAEITEYLLHKGADPNLKNKNSYTALMKVNDAEQMKILLDHGADPNIQNSDGYTALMICAYNGDMEMIQLLLDKKADVNLRSNPPDDGSAFLQAVEEDHLEIMKLLVKHGVDVKKEARLYEDNTLEPLIDYAQSKETRDFISSLL